MQMPSGNSNTCTAAGVFSSQDSGSTLADGIRKQAHNGLVRPADRQSKFGAMQTCCTSGTALSLRAGSSVTVPDTCACCRSLPLLASCLCRWPTQFCSLLWPSMMDMRRRLTVQKEVGSASPLEWQQLVLLLLIKAILMCKPIPDGCQTDGVGTPVVMVHLTSLH